MTDDLARIRENVARWDGLGIWGTYEADAEDYGRMDIAILRDFRILLAEIDRLVVLRDAEIELKAAHDEAADNRWFTPRVLLAIGARDAALAALSP